MALPSAFVPTIWGPLGFAAHPDGILVTPENKSTCHWEIQARAESYLGEGTLTVSFASSSSSFVYDDGNQPLLHAKSEKKDLVVVPAVDNTHTKDDSGRPSIVTVTRCALHIER